MMHKLNIKGFILIFLGICGFYSLGFTLSLSLSNNDNNVKITKDLWIPGWDAKADNAVCMEEEDTLITIAVISAPDHFEQRAAIRGGWGSDALKHSRIAFFFIIGQTDEETVGEDLIMEAQTYQDMAIMKMDDSYHNLALKTIAALTWMKEFCPQSRYLLKVDDDMFIQVYRLITLVKGLGHSPNAESPIIMGKVAAGWKPVRNKQSKYYISEEQYHESSIYPPFVTGPSYLLNSQAVDKILDYIFHVPYVSLEDVFITGIAAEALDIPRRLIVEFKNNPERVPAKFLGCTLLRTISVHKVLPEEQAMMAESAKNPQCGNKNKNVGMKKYNRIKNQIT